MSEKELLEHWIAESKRTVFFGGAGVSTASGIPDFRSSDGILRQDWEGLSAEVLLSSSFFYMHPDRFYAFYRAVLLHPWAEPNAVHRKLAEMEQRGCLQAVVTQNIDALHEKAGSRAVFPLHGSIREYSCLECGRMHGLETVLEQEGVPRCGSCGGILKPGITLYGEAPDPVVMRGACREIARADLLIAAGTSLTVEPAASCLDYFHGKHLVMINCTATERDMQADLVIRERAEVIFENLHVQEKPMRKRQNWWEG